MIGSMDSGLMLRTPRNDEEGKASKIKPNCPTGESLLSYGNVSSEKSARTENISVYQNCKSVLYHPHPVPLRGALHDRSRTWDGWRWTPVVPIANGAKAYGKDVWS